MLKSKLLFLIVLALFLNQCESVKAPRGTVPKRGEIALNAVGGWMRLSFWDTTRQIVEGEFIALGADTVYLMVGGKVEGRGKAEVRQARIVLFKTETSSFSIWTALTSLLALSNGPFFVITAPLALLAGITTTYGESKRINYYEYPAEDWVALRKFARFPQGLPEGIRMSDLKPARYR